MAWLRPVANLKAVFLCCALALVSSAIEAQQSSQALQEWSLQNVRAAWCVHFLMDSSAAEKELPGEFRPLRAADFPALSPAVQNLIKGEPNFSGWIPAEFCGFHFDQATIGGQTIGDPNPQLGQTQFLGAWLIGATPAGGPSGPSSQASYFVATMRSPNWRLIRAAETSLIRMEHAIPSIGKVPESTEDRYQVTMGRTVITWDGHLAGDSSWAPPPEEQTWWSLSSRGASIHAQVRLQPENRQNVAGTLQIAGNDALAKSLRSSPIRMVGPLNWGGTSSLSFVR